MSLLASIEIDHADHALTDLIATARIRADKAAERAMPDTAYVLSDIASTLTNARTQLAADGAEYLDAAWAFVDGARTVLAGIGPDGVTGPVARAYREANRA
jgi:hypothetical protein